MELFYIVTLLLQSIITLSLLWAVHYQRTYIKRLRERLNFREGQLDEARSAFVQMLPARRPDIIQVTRANTSDSPDSNASSAAGASA